MINVPVYPVVRQKSLNLLTQAALAPQAQATAAWNEWRSTYNIDTTRWHDVRMLGVVAARISSLEPDASIRPRVVGIRKFLWVQSQICLQQAVGGLAALERAGIPVMLIKGAARIVSDPTSAHERLIRDVDVLVPHNQQQQAFDVLCGDGWSLIPQKWQIAAYTSAPIAAHHAWSMAKGKSEIDLHHFSNYLNRLRGDDDGLWERSLAIEWQGIHVRVPSPADALVLALTHGIRWSKDSSADWVVDASALLDAGSVDWDVFLAEANMRMLQCILHSGLTYLRDVLKKDVPSEVLDMLQSSVRAEQRDELKQYFSTPIPYGDKQRGIATFMAIQRAMVHAQRFARKPVATKQPQLLQRSSIELAPASPKYSVKLPLPLDKRGQIVLQVKIAGPNNLLRVPVVCTITVPGLTLGVMACETLHADQQDSLQMATLTVPELLLDLRGIKELGISFRMNTRRDLCSATLSIFRKDQ